MGEKIKEGKAKMLFISAELPWPLDGGHKIVTFENLHALSRLFKITVASMVDTKNKAEIKKRINALGENLPSVNFLEPVYHQIRIRRKYFNLLQVLLISLFRRVPYRAAKFISPSMTKLLRNQIQKETPEVICVDNLGLSFYAVLIKKLFPEEKLKFVLFEQNVESDLVYQFYLRQSPRLLRLIAYREWERTRRYEENISRQFDQVIFLSRLDKQRVESWLGNSSDKLWVAPSSVGKLGALSLKKTFTPIVTFVGQLSWLPNEEGITWFAKSIWPELKKICPEVKLKVVGQGLTPISKALLERCGIKVLGYVKDLNPIYAQTSVFIAPLLTAGGIRLKILEAMKAGLPVVTTTIGSSGLEVKDGEQLLIADTPFEFAQAVRRLLVDGELRASLVTKAYSYLKTHHSRKVVFQELKRAFNRLQLSPNAKAERKRVGICGVPIDSFTPHEAINYLFKRGKSLQVVYYANAHCVNMARSNSAYLGVLKEADLVINDGIGINLAARFLYGKAFPERVSATDFFSLVTAAAAKRRLRLFLLGANTEVVTLAASKLEKNYPGLTIAGCHHGYFSENESEEVIRKINESGADILFVAMGVPKQEMWIKKYAAEIKVRQIHAVGGFFDFASGLTSRAPTWIQRLNFEWLYRLKNEPRRLWKRYLLGNPLFLLRVFREKLSNQLRLRVR